MLWLMKCSQEVLQDQWWLGMAHTVRSQILQAKKHWYGLVLGWVTAYTCWRIELRRWITSVLPGELSCSPVLRCVANGRYRQVGDISISADWHQYIHLRIIIGNILATQRSMGENAFLMVSMRDGVFSHSSQNPALGATRLWAGYCELVGENSISPGKPCEMHIVPPVLV